MSQTISAEELKAMRDHALRVGRDPYYAEDPDAKNVLRLADAYEQALKDKERLEADVPPLISEIGILRDELDASQEREGRLREVLDTGITILAMVINGDRAFERLGRYTKCRFCYGEKVGGGPPLFHTNGCYAVNAWGWMERVRKLLPRPTGDAEGRR